MAIEHWSQAKYLERKADVQEMQPFIKRYQVRTPSMPRWTCDPCLMLLPIGMSPVPEDIHLLSGSELDEQHPLLTP